jgi:ABC-type glycerol-3-phosphate transport system substrate-binding protein
MHEEPVYQKLFEGFMNDYQREFPKVAIKPLFTPLADFDTKLQTAFVGGAGPDIIKTGAWTLPGYAQKQQLSSVDHSALGVSGMDQLKARFQTNALSSLTYDGKVYGLPIDFNSTHMYYRTDLFADAGLDPAAPPTTWEQVAEYSAKLTGNGPNGKRVGWQWQHVVPIWTVLQLTPLIDGLGGSILSSDNRSGRLNTPQGIKALEYIASVGDPKISNKQDVFGMFADGQAAMILSSTFSVSLEPSFNSKLKYGKNFAAAPVPQWAAASKKVASGYTWFWGVSSASHNKHTAWHFLNYLQNKSVTDAELKTSGLIVPTKDWQNEPVAAGKPFQILASQVPYTDFGAQVPAWNEMASDLTDAVSAVVNGKKSAAKAAADFDAAMKGVLG